jgi:hypothetical protein
MKFSLEVNTAGVHDDRMLETAINSDSMVGDGMFLNVCTFDWQSGCFMALYRSLWRDTAGWL